MKKKVFVPIFIVFFLFTVRLNAKSNIDSVLYFKQNVALIDAMIRSIDQEHYVKEIYLKDFINTIDLPGIFDYNGTVFNDNGLGYDVVAGDGIYVSVEQYLHTPSIPYQSGVPKKSVLEDCIVDVGFIHHSNLETFLNSYDVPGFPEKIKVSIDCDIYVCSCGSCSCRTCGWPIVGPLGTYIGIVKHCLKITNCHFEITWE
jgi:hypothetical protein